MMNNGQIADDLGIMTDRPITAGKIKKDFYQWIIA